MISLKGLHFVLGHLRHEFGLVVQRVQGCGEESLRIVLAHIMMQLPYLLLVRRERERMVLVVKRLYDIQQIRDRPSLAFIHQFHQSIRAFYGGSKMGTGITFNQRGDNQISQFIRST